MSGNQSPETGLRALAQPLGHRQLDELLMSDLHDMAHSADLLERARDRRFNRNEPPPYCSSTEDDDDDGGPVLVPTSKREEVMAEIERLISEPLNEQELRRMQFSFEKFHAAYHPGRRYEEEAAENFWALLDARGAAGDESWMLSARAREQREKIIVRHRIRKRWERLGVWNPEWGIPGRVGAGPRDDPSSWKWRWQGDTAACGGAGWMEVYIPDHPNSRAARSREGWHRGARPPPSPRSGLAENASRSAAESFITTRPWYTYALDEEEERIRLERIPRRLHGYYNMDHEELVEERWRETGMWNHHKDGRKRPGWKWKHESPSPEPGQDISNLDLTPSEIDALEEIPPPTPQTRGRHGFPIASGRQPRRSAGASFNLIGRKGYRKLHVSATAKTSAAAPSRDTPGSKSTWRWGPAPGNFGAASQRPYCRDGEAVSSRSEPSSSGKTGRVYQA